MTYHNLCKKEHPPIGTKLLLGLGAKFIPQRWYAQPNVEHSINDFNRNIRIKHTFAGSESTLCKDDTKLYVRNLEWEPEKANDEIENRLKQFEEKIRTLTKINTTSQHKRTNLSGVQRTILTQLKNHPKIIVLLADKNLGPVTMDRKEYVERVLTEHLANKTAYKKLPEKQAKIQLNDLKEYFIHLFLNRNNKFNLTETEIKYFSRSLNNPNLRIPQFYGMVKIHKNPWKLRPVVSCCGSALSAIASTWLDYHLQKLKNYVLSYIQDSKQLQDDLQYGTISDNHKLFTCDAVSMYTNICPDHSVEILKEWCETYKNEINQIKGNFPINLILIVLKTVMENNIFQFGNTWWLQKSGTAMGTPCACMITTIYFGYYERKFLLPKHHKNILYYKRFIDDVFCIWDTNITSNTATKNSFDIFRNDMDKHGNLRWEFEQLTDEIAFLDLKIKIDRTTKKLNFQTYQKPMNLHLYIPPHSMHPPGVTKSLIFGLLQTYKQQNTNPDDFQQMAKLLFHRLIARGYNPEELKRLFLEAAYRLDHMPKNPSKKPKDNTNNPSMDKEIFYKTRYHPRDISRLEIRNAYKETCDKQSQSAPHGLKQIITRNGNKMQIEKLTIAYTRDNNIRDMLIPSKLHQPKGIDVESIHNNIRNNTE